MDFKINVQLWNKLNKYALIQSTRCQLSKQTCNGRLIQNLFINNGPVLPVLRTTNFNRIFLIVTHFKKNFPMMNQVLDQVFQSNIFQNWFNIINCILWLRAIIFKSIPYFLSKLYANNQLDQNQFWWTCIAIKYKQSATIVHKNRID